ncbi:hypothetical protein RJ53_02655 [Methanocalculus chunghsingensis]|uniref:Na+/H+ antiporter MnhB subunit-related protein domain-containing protein n=1 Tax=Methanocalculus chunghsingensis TaxID=156457 RepID=A0A8J7W567_9EURY|nr:MnhB domain-containing protein [Methanocalculus chunghsingensis]MBR1368461.1 hypothetical protein [Methanocalculus chunghsingensis]
MTRSDIIVRTIARLMVPFLLLFGAYILLHGHLGAGGGFQAGIIFTSALILAAIGRSRIEFRSQPAGSKLWILGVSGAVLFGVTGFLGIVSGGFYLQYSLLPLPFPVETIHAIMITIVEIGIGIAVSGMICLVFLTITGRGE